MGGSLIGFQCKVFRIPNIYNVNFGIILQIFIYQIDK